MRGSIVNFDQCRLEFGDYLNADAAFACEDVGKVCGVNSGLCGEFPKADFFTGLFGSRKNFFGFLLLFLKGVDCGLESGDGLGRGGDFPGEQAGDFAD